jgi:hypothetical protein
MFVFILAYSFVFILFSILAAVSGHSNYIIGRRISANITATIEVM